VDWTTLTGAKSVPGSLASWANNSTIQTSTPMIIEEAESWIYRGLRHWKMLVPPVVGVLTVGSDLLAIPSDMLEVKNLYLTGNYYGKLTQKDEETVMASWSYDSSQVRVSQTPRIYYFNQSSIQFDSPADQAYAYALTYFQQPAALSASNTTNFLTSTYQRLVRCACMIGVAEWAKESGQGSFDRTYWIQEAMGELAKAQMESDRAKRATSEGVIFLGEVGGGRDAAYGSF
jgi:hypothetical protein